MRVFRPGATILPFLIWTLMIGAAAILLERHALQLARGTEARWMFQLLVTACVILGPVAFIAHVARRVLVSVTVTEAGLELTRGRRIPWNAVAQVDHRAAPFRGGKSLEGIGNIGSGCELLCWGEGCLIGLALVAVLAIGYWILLPVFSLLSPWHSRVIIHLKDGDRMVFRDLDDDAEFVALVRARTK